MTTLIASSRSLLFPGITRESISWRTVSPGVVEIAVDLENPESESTTPGELVIETADFGAFVPFRPVTRIALGSLEPGGRRRATTRVPRGLLAEPVPATPDVGSVMAQVASQHHMNVKPEVLQLMMRAQWVGNLNVFFDREPARAVEVHRGFDLQVKSSHPVIMIVDLPTDRNQYDIDVRVSDPAWRAEVIQIFHMSNLVVQPPTEGGRQAQITIDVTRRSDGRCVPVELSLETQAS
jgi:hypothetical protein